MALPFFWQQALKRSTLLDIETTGLDPSRHAPLGAAHGRFGGPLQETWFTYEYAERTPEGPWYRKFGIKTEEEMLKGMEPFSAHEWNKSWKQAREGWLARGGQPVPARKYFSKLFAREARAGRFLWTHNVRFDITQFGSQYAHPAAQELLYEGAHIPGWTQWDPYSGRLYPTTTRTGYEMRQIAYEKPRLAPGAMREWYGSYRTMVKGAVAGKEPAILDSLSIAQSMMGMAQQQGAMAKTGDVFTGTSLEALGEAFQVTGKGRGHLAVTDVEKMERVLPKVLETAETLYKGEKLAPWQMRALKYLGEVQPEIAQRNIERSFAQAVLEKRGSEGKFRLSRGGYSKNLDDLVAIYKKNISHRTYYEEGMLEETMAKVQGMGKKELEYMLHERAKVPALGRLRQMKMLRSARFGGVRQALAKQNPMLMAGAAALGLAVAGAVMLPSRHEHNTVQGFREEGMNATMRHLVTDFGSGYQGAKEEDEDDGSIAGTIFKGWMLLSFGPLVAQHSSRMLMRGARTARTLVTGRRALMHGASKAATESIGKEGLLMKHSLREQGITQEMLVKGLGRDPKKYKDLVYLTESGYEARGYAAQAEALETGASVEGAKAAAQKKMLNPATHIQSEGITKFSIPTWKEEFKTAQRSNPEIGTEGFTAWWKENVPQMFRGNPVVETFSKLQSVSTYSSLERSAVYARDIGPEWIVGSETFNKLGMSEWKQYASLHPGRVAAGAGIGAVTAATPFVTASFLFGDDEGKIDGLSEQGLASRMRKKNTDFGSGHQGVLAVSKWVANFAEKQTAKYLTQAEVKDMMVYLRGQIKSSQLLRVGKSSFGLEMTPEVMAEHIGTLRMLEAAKGYKGGATLLHKENLLAITDRAERVRVIQGAVRHEGFHSAAANQPVLRQAIARAPIPENVQATLRVEGYGLRTGRSVYLQEGSKSIEEYRYRIREEAANFLVIPEAAKISHEGVQHSVEGALKRVKNEAWLRELEDLHRVYMPTPRHIRRQTPTRNARQKMTGKVQEANAPGSVPGIDVYDTPQVPGMLQKIHRNRSRSKQMYQR